MNTQDSPICCDRRADEVVAQPQTIEVARIEIAIIEKDSLLFMRASVTAAVIMGQGLVVSASGP
ncbi:MAG: hypothetical protein SGI88_02210 [Candidatus Hydrogenedentes bacterium]|nr:hypothetical protein [Candidatus Hydrogenedentota bacterium]